MTMVNEKNTSHVKIVLFEIISLIILYIGMSLKYRILVNVFLLISLIGFPVALSLLIKLTSSGIHWFIRNKAISTKKDISYLCFFILMLIALIIIPICVIKYIPIYIHPMNRVDGLKVQ